MMLNIIGANYETGAMKEWDVIKDIRYKFCGLGSNFAQFCWACYLGDILKIQWIIFYFPFVFHELLVPW